MALTQEELQIVKHGKENGKTKSEVMMALSNYRATKPKVAEEKVGIIDTVAEAGEDISQAFTGAKEAVTRGMETAEEARQQVVAEEISPLAGTVKTIGGGLKAGAGVVGQAFTGLLKLPFSQEGEEKIREKAVQGLSFIAKTPGGEKLAEGVNELTQNYKNLTPEQKAYTDGILGALEAGVETVGLGKGEDVVKAGAKQLRTLFKDATFNSVDDLITKTDDVIKQTTPLPTRVSGATLPSDILTKAEVEAPQLTLKEKWIGISPDIKKRLAGKQDQLQEYFDVAHARNLDDTLDTPYSFGAKKVENTVQQMEDLLNQTGSEIGATRQRLGTVQANIDQVQKIESTFANELDKLNLTIRNGQVIQKPGTISRVGSTSDIKVLNDLYENLRVAKQSPTLTNLIDLRSGFDSKIKFAKRASEASNSVDPLSRQVRKTIADTAADIVGPTEASKLQDYSNFMDAYADLRSFTDRKAGSEYLLRLVLSGRGREASELLDTVKKYTGTDLMDDATMMTIATDLIGNARQQNLFRQEVTKAGLDVAKLSAGRGEGAIGLLTDFATKRLLDEEKIFLEAAGSKAGREAGEVAFGGVAGIEIDEDGKISFDPTKALLGVAGMKVAGKMGKKELIKKAKTSLSNETKDEMAKFVDVVKGKHVRTDKDGFLVFTSKEAERDFENGMRILTDRQILSQNFGDGKSLGEIANLYDDIISNK